MAKEQIGNERTNKQEQVEGSMGTQPPLLPGPGAQPCTARKRPRGGQLLGAQQTETWNIFIASDSPAIKVPGARASRYRVYGVIGLHIGNYPNYPTKHKAAW